MNKIERSDRSPASGPGLLLIGGLAGGLIGAALAFWYAPQTGKRTQAMLKREAGRLQKQVNATASGWRTSAEDIAADAAERAADLASQGRAFVSEKAHDLRHAVKH